MRNPLTLKLTGEVLENLKDRARDIFVEAGISVEEVRIEADYNDKSRIDVRVLPYHDEVLMGNIGEVFLKLKPQTMYVGWDKGKSEFYVEMRGVPIQNVGIELELVA